jgi:hypothetical protein
MVSGSVRVAQSQSHAPKIVLAALGGMVGWCTGDSTRREARCARATRRKTVLRKEVWTKRRQESDEDVALDVDGCQEAE